MNGQTNVKLVCENWILWNIFELPFWWLMQQLQKSVYNNMQIMWYTLIMWLMDVLTRIGHNQIPAFQAHQDDLVMLLQIFHHPLKAIVQLLTELNYRIFKYYLRNEVTPLPPIHRWLGYWQIIVCRGTKILTCIISSWRF